MREDLQQFLIYVVSSVEQLEILLLLRREPERAWSASEVSAELRGNAESAQLRLVSLLEHALVENVPNGGGGMAHFRYRPATPRLAALVDAVAQAYAERRYSVINTLYSGSTRKLTELADAFKFNKKKEVPDHG